jgi:proteasome lid subunit RPN8/RPN11
MQRRVLLKTAALETLLHLARSAHPNEMVVLLRGEAKKEIKIEEVLLAPFALGGEDFSEFPLDSLPIDPSIIGTAHSHPRHVLEASEEDLNESYGHVSLIIAYPYSSTSDVAAYSSLGERLVLKIV